MKVETVKQAIAEAKEFIKRAQVCLAEDVSMHYPKEFSCLGSRNTGRMKRQSHELSEMLVKIRRGE